VKLLVINADDLGYDPEIDRGILEAHAGGLVTSATAMVETPFAEAALRAAPATLGVGLHAVVDPSAGRGAARAALIRQLERFEALRGAPPTHLDSHKHAHAHPEVLAALAEVAAARALPVRALDAPMRATLRAAGLPVTDAFLGDADRRPAWTLAALLAALEEVEEGWTELMAHPGHAPSHARTSFGAEREVELAALCAPAARALVARRGITLGSYRDLARVTAARGAPPAG
jgi:predicted glycoside hydrolase/deacetylase ChbG (UPF0249 family)